MAPKCGWFFYCFVVSCTLGAGTAMGVLVSSWRTGCGSIGCGGVIGTLGGGTGGMAETTGVSEALGAVMVLSLRGAGGCGGGEIARWRILATLAYAFNIGGPNSRGLEEESFLSAGAGAACPRQFAVSMLLL